jgi:hypothetical protein
MTIKAIAERKQFFATRQVGEELILVPLKDNVADMDEMFTLNDVGSFIWEMIDENKTVDDLERAIIAEYEVDQQEAKKDLEEFLEKLSSYIIKQSN